MGENCSKEQHELCQYKFDEGEKKFERIDKKLDRLIQGQEAQGLVIAGLQVKSGVWGVLGGVLTTLGAFLLALLSGILKVK